MAQLTHTQRYAPNGQTGEQERSCPGHRTRNTTHQTGIRVSRSQVTRYTAEAKQSTE